MGLSSEVAYSLSAEEVQGLEPLLSGSVSSDLRAQVVSECYSGNQQLAESLAPLLQARYPSQLFQAASDGPVLLLLMGLIWLVARKPGTIAGWFLIGYEVLREVTELFRERHVGALEVGEIRTAMVLSIGLIIAGILLVIWSSARKTDRIGGLLKGSPALE